MTLEVLQHIRQRLAAVIDDLKNGKSLSDNELTDRS